MGSDLAARKRRAKHRLWTVATVAGAALLLLLGGPLGAGLLPGCALRSLTGFWCPGCGATRALFRLFQGDVAGALGLNALVVLALPLAALLGLMRVPPLRGYGLAGGRGRSLWLVFSLGAGVAIFWIARNVDADPFRALAP